MARILTGWYAGLLAGVIAAGSVLYGVIVRGHGFMIQQVFRPIEDQPHFVVCFT